MDLESESLALEFVEDNEGITHPCEKLDDTDDTVVGTNGSCIHENRDNGNVNMESGVDSPVGIASPSSPSLSPGGTKGYGLKKWRRIRRDAIQEGGRSVDASKLLKRELPDSGANLNRSTKYSGGMEQNSQGSVSSTNALFRSSGNKVDRFAATGDSGIGPWVRNGTDSENSEDRSSKSSTAASALKMTGHALDKNRMRTLSGKNLGNSVQQGKTGKGRSETGKKLKGEVVKIEKENSHSSMESDSRSSNFVFMQGINSVTSNGRQSGRSQNYDGENSDEAPCSVRHPSEELQVGSSGKNGVAFEDNYQEDLAADSSWGTKEGKSENNGPSSDEDPLLDSISSLQSAKEALEEEIHKFMEIGKEHSTPDESIQDGSLEQLQSGDLGIQSFYALEPEVIRLKQTIKVLESKLDDAKALLNMENYGDMEAELEDLFKQKIEAEVEYLATSRTVQKLRVALVDQITILEERKTEQAWMLNKLGDAEAKAAKLKGEAEKLENYCEEIVDIDETIKLKTGICKYSSCFFIQSMLLFTILIMFIWKLSPDYSEVVPT